MNGCLSGVGNAFAELNDGYGYTLIGMRVVWSEEKVQYWS